MFIQSSNFAVLRIHRQSIEIENVYNEDWDMILYIIEELFELEEMNDDEQSTAL